MWNEYENLTPEERLDKIVEILTEGVLRLSEEKKPLSSKEDKKASVPMSLEEVLQNDKKDFQKGQVRKLLIMSTKIRTHNGSTPVSIGRRKKVIYYP